MSPVFLAAGKLTLMVTAPFLLAVGLVGLVVSALQAAAGVQDQASSQAARLVTGALVALLTGPWVLRTLSNFCQGLWGNLGGYLR